MVENGLITKEIKKAFKQLDSYYKELIKANNNYDSYMRKKLCTKCEFFTKSVYVEKQFDNCPVKNCSVLMKEIVTNVEQAKTKIDNYKKDVLGKMVFERGTILKPKLIHYFDKTIHEWDEIFGQRYSDLSFMQIKYLVNFIEGTGTYRLI